MEKQELHIDFKVAKAAFEKYLDEYDRTDDKIHLKIVHTYCVVDAAEEIATRMHLREEDVQLAKIIGLLHDIGRFEQIKRFHSFEPGTMDHAVYGADLLFGPEQMIRRFVTDPSFDQLIRVATKYPNIAKDYFYNQKHQTVELIKLNGSIELAPIVGLSEVIVDIVETGSTLRENGLKVLEEVCPLSARMVVNQVSMKMEGERIHKLITDLRNVMDK